MSRRQILSSFFGIVLFFSIATPSYAGTCTVTPNTVQRGTNVDFSVDYQFDTDNIFLVNSDTLFYIGSPATYNSNSPINYKDDPYFYWSITDNYNGNDTVIADHGDILTFTFNADIPTIEQYEYDTEVQAWPAESNFNLTDDICYFTINLVDYPVGGVDPSVGTISPSANPVVVNTSTAASAAFTDADITDTHTAVWEWGDGMTTACPSAECTITESNGSGLVLGSHTYTTTGVYVIKLTVTDSDGLSASQEYQYIAVYDPTPQSLFSGVRKFTSPVGAYAQNPSLTGLVQFGVSARYSGSQATSRVSMEFKAGNLNFDSTSTTLLVTANGKATLRGIGTINSIGNYTFLVTGIDNQDTIRFQIKDQSGNVIYDTQPGAADDIDPTTPVTGQVIVH